MQISNHMALHQHRNYCTIVVLACAYYHEASRVMFEWYVTGILVPVILVLGTNFFVENFGPPDQFFRK